MEIEKDSSDKQLVSISVRELVETVFLEGDLFTNKSFVNAMQEGIQIHKKVQNDQKEADEKYIAEYSLSYDCELDNIKFHLTGRIDGITVKNGSHFIEEIKSTIIPLEQISEETFPVHWAQAKCYAYMYSVQKKLAKANVSLVYYQKETGEIRRFTQSFLIESLGKFFFETLELYSKWASRETQWEIIRNESIEKMKFPFMEYRDGQLDLIESIQNVTKNGEVLFAQAPTGIGKTMAALYATINNFPKSGIKKIFYLTARTVARVVAEKACKMLNENGLKFRSITLTAKEKICLMGMPRCQKDKCPYTKGYFNRVFDATDDILSSGMSFTSENIVLFAQKYMLCPFEFSLDLSLWCDCVICDYNYVFDPKVYLKRYFFGNKGSGKYVFLIDEAHNMIKRSQEMFSVTLCENETQKAIATIKDDQEKILGALKKLETIFVKNRQKMSDEDVQFLVNDEMPEESLMIVEKASDDLKKALEGEKHIDISEQITDLYYNLSHFVKIHDFYDSHFKYLVQTDKYGKIQCKEFCMDPSKLLQHFLNRGYATVFFSATLSPIHYFVRMLGGTRDSIQFNTSSPFPRENLSVMIENDVSTKYRERQNSYEIISKYIQSIVNAKKGNYLVFFPSYAYMNKVHDYFQLIKNKTSCIIQRPFMKERERMDFLKAFSYQHGRSLVGFAVMGGIFGEGIDLVGEQLSGAIIVGVGLPGISLENMVLKNYFDENDESGYGYAFVFPGINRVLQAVGRVIRTEEDKGAVLLIDKRFDHPTYRKLLPEEWGYVPAIHNPDLYESLLKAFWKQQ